MTTPPSTSLTIGSGDLTATFLPALGMLGASVQYHGTEMLRRIEDLGAAAAKGSTAGIPLLYPWANRLAGFRYRAAGRDVTLDKASPMVHLDGNGAPMHGVPWALLHWTVLEAGPTRIAAALDWNRADLLAVFPFPHRIEMVASVATDGLTIRTSIVGGAESHVPVSFGFHPYFGIAGMPRGQWRFRTPPMHRFVLDARGIPTGPTEPFGAFDGPLGDHAFDDGFALENPSAVFSLSGAGTRITVEFLQGFRFAQIFAPVGKDYIAIEPMTAPTNALVSDRDLTVVPPGCRFDGAFRIQIEDNQ